MNTKTLEGQVAIVVGGSRGAGRGIAISLGEAGATVYVAARTSRNGPKPADGAPGTIEDTADEVTARGGAGIPVRADLADEEQAAALFRRVEAEQGRLDVLANGAWGPNCIAVWSKRFWDLDGALWRETLDTVGVCWFASVYAARLMVKQRRGLILHVTDNFPDEPSKHRGQILHDLGHECLNRLIVSMAKEAKKSGVTVAGINPGFMRTERVLMSMTSEKVKKQFRFELSESVEFIGRAVVALASDPKILRKTGQLLRADALADEYGFTDVDGRIPRFDYTPPENLSFA